MPTYRSSVEIAAPPDVVFERIADIGRHGDWSTDPLEISSDGKDRFRSTTRAKGKVITAEITVVERQAPRLLAFDVVDATGRWRHTFTLEASPAGGTRVVRATSGRLSAAQAVLYWVVLLPVKKPNASRALRKLKSLVEAG